MLTDDNNKDNNALDIASNEPDMKYQLMLKRHPIYIHEFKDIQKAIEPFKEWTKILDQRYDNNEP